MQQSVLSLFRTTCIFFVVFIRSTVTSNQCSNLFLTLESTNQKLYTCDSIPGEKPLKLCYNQQTTSEPGLTINITKDNEGLYSCCCGECQTMCTEKKVIYGEQTLNDSIFNTLEVEWGGSFTIHCPYTPGRLIEDTSKEYYESKWDFQPLLKSGSIKLYPLADDNVITSHFSLDRTSNTIAAKNFSPIRDLGTYKCGLSLLLKLPANQNTYTFDIKVTTKKSPSITTASIKSPPKSLIASTEDEIAQFNCIASVPTFSYKSIGFNITNLISSSQTQSIIADLQDDSCVSDDITVNCTNQDSSLSLECSYAVPYEVDCKLVMKNVNVNNSSRITCFVADDDDVTSDPVNLFVIPQSNCSNAVIDEDKKSLQYMFRYPMTGLTVTVSFQDGIDGSYSNTTGTLSEDGMSVSVTVPEDITSGHYKIYLNDTLSKGMCSFNFTTSPVPMSLPSVPTPSSSIISSPSSSSPLTLTVTMSPSTTLSLPVSTSTTPSSAEATLPVVAAASASAGIFLVLIVIVLIVILILLIRMSGKKKKDQYNLATGETGETTYIDNGNHCMKPLTHHLSPDHLSPEQSSTQCDSCSQASSCTFLTDEPSPRHHQPSHSSRSSHSRSSNSCPSTSHLKNKPLPRYGIPDHYPQYQMHQQQQLQLQQPFPHHHQQHHPMSLSFSPNPPDITVITPTPTMENQPVLEPVTDHNDCMSPTGTEPFSSPNTPSDDLLDYFSNKKEPSRPSNLPISPLAKSPDSSASTPLSDQTMIGILLFLQHKDCDKKENCQTCKLIKRHFERIATKYGRNALNGMVKQLNTPGSEGTLKHLRKREKKLQRLRSPHRQAQAPSLAVTTTFQRQRSHSASHLDEDDFTFSSTETDDDSLKPSNKRNKQTRTRKVFTDDEKEDYSHQRKLPLQRINELSMSNYDIPSTPLDGFFPGSVAVGTKDSSESDSTDDNSSARTEFDSSKPSGLSMSFTKSPDSSLPFQQDQKYNTFTSNNSSSGYETDNVFDQYRTTSDERGDSPPQHTIPNNAHHVTNSHRHSDNRRRPTRYSEDNASHSIMSDDSSNNSYQYNPQYSLPVATCGSQSTDYLKAASRKHHGGSGHRQQPMFGNNLSLSGSGILSMHSSPGGNNRYRTQGSNQSNHSIHSESALQNYPRTQKLLSSPPGQRKTRTPSPIQVVLPGSTSSATPI